MADPFTQAPDEVLRYFEAKDLVPTEHWQDFAATEHALHFTVARSAGYDILDDIHTATLEAIKTYQPYGDFVDSLEPTLRKKGWWGSKVHFNPTTGERAVVQLGSLRRLRTIYWANTTTARAAGEWERTQNTKRGLPYLIYDLSAAEKRRPEHLGWVGVILPVDDPFWQTHYPPNGWLCKCRVRQISKYEAEKLGYDPTTPAPQVIYRDWKNKRTGKSYQVPKGIDPGWQSNPGVTRAVNASKFLGERLEALSPHARSVAVRDLVGSKMFRALQGGDIPYAGRAERSAANIERGRIALPVGLLPDDVQKLMSAKTRTVLLSNADAHKQLSKRLRKDGTPLLSVKDYAAIQKIIENGEMFEDALSNQEFIFHMMIDGKPWAVIMHVTKNRDEIFLKSYRRINADQFGESDRLIPMK